jgi:hypothetical protein
MADCSGRMYEKDDKNAFDFCFQTFERIKKEEKEHR